MITQGWHRFPRGVNFLLLLGLFVGFTAPLYAFSYVKVGDVLANPSLISDAGISTPLLGGKVANLVLFLQPDQLHSQVMAKTFAQKIEPEMAQKSVSMVAVCSSRYAPELIQEFRAQSGLQMPILNDIDDEVVGALGIFLHPAAALTDNQNILRAAQYFTEINFIDVIRGQIRYLLGEITQEELEQILNPTPEQRNENRIKAQRWHSFARMLYKQNRIELALENIQKSISYDNTLSPAHSLYGLLLKTKGDCTSARTEFEWALRLDPTNTEASDGLGSCPVPVLPQVLPLVLSP